MTDADIIDRIFEEEGGRPGLLIDRADDRGGPTNGWGVTLATLSRVRGRACTTKELQAMTHDEAARIAVDEFVIRPGFTTIGDMGLRWALVDWGYNSGPARAIKGLQEALGMISRDGRLGPITIGKANTTDGRRAAIRVCTCRLEFLARWAAGDLADNDRDGVPDNLEKLVGIVRRTNRIINAIA